MSVVTSYSTYDLILCEHVNFLKRCLEYHVIMHPEKVQELETMTIREQREG